jgi:hypothetical protein
MSNREFGGAVEGTSVGLPPKTDTRKKVSEGSPVKKRSSVDDDKNNGSLAKIDLKYAFGSSVTNFDSVLTYGVATGGDKESNDRLVYRVGKQICVLDPENGNQQFFTGRSRNVTNVLHFAISPNQKYICMCESLRQDGKDDMGVLGTAQLSVYSLLNFTKLKTLAHPSHSEFVSVSFCGDPRYIAALIDGKSYLDT